jgi:deoxycytidine triphosphate deaminase/addiction module HigA family antidote
MSADTPGHAIAALKAQHRAHGDQSPGEHLRAEIERLNLDQVAVSNATGVSRQSINNIVNGRQPISRAMAAKLGRLTGHSSDYWLHASFRLPPRANETAGFAEREPAAARPFGVGVLVNHQIARAVKDGVIGIDPFDEQNVQLASIDLTLDDFIITTDGEKVDASGGHDFILKAGRTVNVSTREWIEFPQDYIGRIGAMTRLASIGIMTSHGFQIDPGFKGNLHFCIFNATAKNFTLRSGMPIISLEIMPLSVTPAYDERAVKQVREAGVRENVVSLFRNSVCDRLIREAVRAGAKVDIGGEGAKATLSELSIEIFDVSADAALEGAVHGALEGLKALRDKPHAAREDHEKYAAFFGEIAEHLYLTGEQARRALSCLDYSVENADALIASLRGGGEVLVPLPVKSARITLRHLARRLREDPLDLILIVTGLRDYQAEK